jgi:hypothetical protein
MYFSLYDHPEWRRVVIGDRNNDDVLLSHRTKKTCSLTKFRMRRWKLREEMKKQILPWQPVRFMSGALAKQPARWLSPVL